MGKKHHRISVATVVRHCTVRKVPVKRKKFVFYAQLKVHELKVSSAFVVAKCYNIRQAFVSFVHMHFAVIVAFVDLNGRVCECRLVRFHQMFERIIQFHMPLGG